jgi:hypothetical protein
VKLIPIAPYALLAEQDTDMQLVLPHCLLQSVSYAHWHLDQPKSYKILDNGAAEGEDVPDEILLDLAEKYKVSELVLPDSLGDRRATETKSLVFMRMNTDRILKLVEGGMRLGVVAQGRHAGEACITARDILDRIALDYAIDVEKEVVVHVPRILITATGRPMERVYTKNRLETIRPGLTYHALGTNPAHLDELKALNNAGFRSCDTSAPFNFARAGLPIREFHREPAPRQEDYFRWHPSIVEHTRSLENILIMRKWAGDV